MPIAVNNHGKLRLNAEEEQWLKENYLALDNHMLAFALGVKITWLRMQLYSLGLKRMEF